MQSFEKSIRKNKYPSFSSTLLDEIYRSIDKKDGEEQNSCNGNVVRKKINNPIEEDEEMASINRRTCLIDKWMEKKVNGKNFITKEEMLDFEKDNDPLYFSSSSISSDSSSGTSGGFSSSSETEFFSVSADVAKTRTSSCFATSWRPIKPIKTKVQESVHNNVSEKKDTALIKSRSRAVKIYTNFKNLKQPISPGGRLTSFINSLFKTGVDEEVEKSGKKMEKRKCKSNQTSTCSSATSFSRSCLSKTPSTTTSRGNKIDQMNNVSKRTVSFTVEEMQRSREMEMEMEMVMDGVKAYTNYKKDGFVVVEDEDDAASDCSSDLFEIDHMILFGNQRFCEELPVYETTHLNKNLAIASGLVR